MSTAENQSDLLDNQAPVKTTPKKTRSNSAKTSKKVEVNGNSTDNVAPSDHAENMSDPNAHHNSADHPELSKESAPAHPSDALDSDNSLSLTRSADTQPESIHDPIPNLHLPDQSDHYSDVHLGVVSPGDSSEPTQAPQELHTILVENRSAFDVFEPLSKVSLIAGQVTKIQCADNQQRTQVLRNIEQFICLGRALGVVYE